MLPLEVPLFLVWEACFFLFRISATVGGKGSRVEGSPNLSANKALVTGSNYLGGSSSSKSDSISTGTTPLPQPPKGMEIRGLSKVVYGGWFSDHNRRQNRPRGNCYSLVGRLFLLLLLSSALLTCKEGTHMDGLVFYNAKLPEDI